RRRHGRCLEQDREPVLSFLSDEVEFSVRSGAGEEVELPVAVQVCSGEHARRERQRQPERRAGGPVEAARAVPEQNHHRFGGRGGYVRLAVAVDVRRRDAVTVIALHRRTWGRAETACAVAEQEPKPSSIASDGETQFLVAVKVSDSERDRCACDSPGGSEATSA